VPALSPAEALVEAANGFEVLVISILT
jgi:hypothetical protein